MVNVGDDGDIAEAFDGHLLWGSLKPHRYQMGRQGAG
jgi:hypothetical protein